MTLIEPSFRPGCLIGGNEVWSDRTLPVHHPYTGRQVGEVPLLGAREVRRALDLGARTLSVQSRDERAAVLERCAVRLEAEAEDVARLITWESGLALRDTRHEVCRAGDVLRAAATLARHDDGEAFAGDASPIGRARRVFTGREPVGLVAAITPFNHPLNQVAHKVAPAVAAGAPMVLKPSERTPLAALWLARALHDCGLPAGALSVVLGDRELVLEAMLTHPAVEVVTFTGSVAVGRHIAGRLGYRRAVLELGGNDPLVVLADADLDLAAALAVEGATRNSGQRCTAVKRVIVDRDVADAVAALAARRCRELVAGDPFAEGTDVGTVIDEDAARTIDERVREACSDGARLLAGGDRRGALVEPTVLDHVRPEMAVVREETFGPVCPIITVDGPDEALRVANGTPFGLSAGVVTRDLDAALRFVRELRCGSVNVNEVPGWRTESMPFGGVGDSGLGVKEGVREAIRAMTWVKAFSLPWPTPEGPRRELPG